MPTIRSSYTACASVLSLLLHCVALPASAATDLSPMPLFATADINVPPNIFFILDDSDRSADRFKPYEMGGYGFGLYSHHCNSLAFNPAYTYTPPQYYDGSSVYNATFTAAADGWAPYIDLARGSDFYPLDLTTRSSYVGLRTKYYVYTGQQPDLGYSFTHLSSPYGMSYESDHIDNTSLFFLECTSNEWGDQYAEPGASVFTKVDVRDHPELQQNYANWITYYHTTRDALKTVITRAMAGLNPSYRIGYDPINNETVNLLTHSYISTKPFGWFLDIKPFDAAQRTEFYRDLFYTYSGASEAPRSALAMVGQYFANKAAGQTYDPVQYSCQRNHVILASAGYENNILEDFGSAFGRYAPNQLDALTAVGNQDGGNTPRPMFDGEGQSDTTADVAMYYYKTDLRSTALGNCTGALGQDVCTNNVPRNGRDAANWQHVTFHALAYGNAGYMHYDPNYLTQTTGDFADVRNGVKQWPRLAFKGISGTDDIWHATVNSGGRFLFSNDPQELTVQLKSLLQGLGSVSGTGSSATTSSLQPVTGDSDVFVGQFTTEQWTGDLRDYAMDPASGVISDDVTWSAQQQLSGLSASSRTIYFGRQGVLTPFVYDQMGAATQALFSNFCSANDKPGVAGTTHPGQCGAADAAAQALANSGANLVNYLRGDPANANDGVYRSRAGVLGDIVNASPVVVGNPGFAYADDGYTAFAAHSRTAVVYAAANDGMLHAFNRRTGNELWAFVPSAVLPTLYKLADTNYPAHHMPLVDATPTVGDVYDASTHAWRSILVGGLGLGGRSYYALDITVPASPTLLWEFSDADLGYTFGNPLITKQADGTWVVAFASGYNNVNPGDGNGHLYVLDAISGARLQKINTLLAGNAVGTSLTPSGLSKINAYVESAQNNTAQAIYGGDLLGNVWRFDISSQVQPYLSAMQLAKLQVGTTPQPITTKPALAQIHYHGTPYKVVYVGTGKYLGSSDITNSAPQSIYALKDDGSSTGLGDVRAATGAASLVVQTASNANGIRVGTSNPVDWGSKAGWYLDLPGSGERVTANPNIVLDSLYVAGNTPSDLSCSAGGSSWLYKVDLASGAPTTTSANGSIATPLGSTLAVGLVNVQLPNHQVETVLTHSDSSLSTETGAQPMAHGILRRIAWRILH